MGGKEEKNKQDKKIKHIVLERKVKQREKVCVWGLGVSHLSGEEGLLNMLARQVLPEKAEHDI